jgi:hypothetical protein
MIVFVHFGKAGGNTLFRVAEQNCRTYDSPFPGTPVRRTGPGPNEWKIERWWNWSPEKQRAFLTDSKYDFIVANLGPDNKRQTATVVLWPYVDYVTVLRDPLDLMLSRYNHLQWAGSRGHKSVPDDRRTVVPPDKPIKEWLLTTPGDNMFTRMFGNSFDEPDLDSAKKRLHELSALMLIESFQDDIMVMQRKFGWKDINVTKHRAGTKHNSSARARFKDDKAFVNELKKRHSLDLELMEYARQVKGEINR